MPDTSSKDAQRVLAVRHVHQGIVQWFLSCPRCQSLDHFYALSNHVVLLRMSDQLFTIPCENQGVLLRAGRWP